MTVDIKLLPLPEEEEWNVRYGYHADTVREYARTCVAHATTAKDAEIEALRVDVEAWNASHSLLTDTCHHFQARAKRLAEALREVQPFIGWVGSYEGLHAKIDALLRDQEEGK